MTSPHRHPQQFLQRVICIIVLCFCSNAISQEKKGLSEEEQLDRMLQHHNERYMPKALGFSAGYATPNVFDFSIFSILGAFPVNIKNGYDIGASDDALFAAGGWFLFNGIEAIANKITNSGSGGPGILVLAWPIPATPRTPSALKMPSTSTCGTRITVSTVLSSMAWRFPAKLP